MPSDVITGTGAAAFEARLAELRRSPAYRNYELVRNRVLEMRALEAQLPHYTPSAYWFEELANFEYVLDASPLIIDKLRHHSFHITGLRVYDYRSQRDRWRERFVEKRRALLKHGKPELLVPEWRPLGGFGFDIDGDLYNLDTLKFFEVLIALDRGSVLGEFRGNTDRRLVWEIGAGWGGFPYQFKTLCPNVTYVITDFPELFLFSATYLMTAFPDAKVRFWGEEPFAETLANWRQLRLHLRPEHGRRRVRAGTARSGGEYGLVPGDDRGPGDRLREPGVRAELPVPVQPQSRTLVVQQRARKRERHHQSLFLAA